MQGNKEINIEDHIETTKHLDILRFRDAHKESHPELYAEIDQWWDDNLDQIGNGSIVNFYIDEYEEERYPILCKVLYEAFDDAVIPFYTWW